MLINNMTACAPARDGWAGEGKRGTRRAREREERERERGGERLVVPDCQIRVWSITFAVGYTIGIPDLL